MLIDVHHHLLPDFLREAFDRAGRRPSIADFPDWSSDSSQRQLDHLSVDRAILSVPPPGVHLGDDDAARSLARRTNDFGAELASTTGDRLSAFAALPLPDVAGAVEEARRCLTAGSPGVSVLASYGDTFLGDPAFDPVMAELEDRHATVFVHPVGHPSSRALPSPAPLWMLEYPIDTTRAALNMILHEIPDRYPNVSIVLAHAGGTLPFLSTRLRAMGTVDPRFARFTPERVDRAVANFYYDSAQAMGRAAFSALRAVTTPDHILFGTDFPYCNARAIDDMVAALDDLPGARREMTAAGTSLFGPGLPDDPSGAERVHEEAR